MNVQQKHLITINKSSEQVFQQEIEPSSFFHDKEVHHHTVVWLFEYYIGLLVVWLLFLADQSTKLSPRSSIVFSIVI